MLGRMFVKSASGPDDCAVVDRIMQRIHDENPGHWPNGVSRAHFDGGLYLISKTASAEPVGFVGWQEREEDGRRIGYYSIGLLPEHRRQGIAKEAVSRIIRTKSASVHEVRALVVSTNAPSKRLAAALENVVLIEKSAAAKQLLSIAGGGLGNAVFWDQAADPHGRDMASSLQPWKWDKERLLQGGINALLGASGGATIHAGKPKTGIGILALSPVKDLAMKAQSTLHKVDQAADASSKALSAPPDTNKGLSKTQMLAAAALGTAGLGAAGYLAYRQGKALKAQEDAARGGRIRVTLPTKKPGDAETVIESPISAFPMSAALKGRIDRDARARLLEETRLNTKKRKPKDPNNLTDAERQDLELEMEREEFAKVAGISHFYKLSAAAAATTPTPPMPGQNPAQVMNQQAAAAQQAAQGASTDANPQIMAAQQEAAMAEQTAQQQQAQVEQQAQQQQMQQEQKHAQELAQRDQEIFAAQQEKELMQMEVEKSKVESELAAAKAKVSGEIEAAKKDMESGLAANDDSAVSAITNQRLGRIESLIHKSSAATRPISEGLVSPGAAQQINRGGFEYLANSGIAPTHIYRTSYGKPLDSAFQMLGRQFLLTPSQNATADLPPVTGELPQPDLFGTFARYGHDFLRSPR